MYANLLDVNTVAKTFQSLFSPLLITLPRTFKNFEIRFLVFLMAFPLGKCFEAEVI